LNGEFFVYYPFPIDTDPAFLIASFAKPHFAREEMEEAVPDTKIHPKVDG
jgi:hypothetical protein